MGRRDPPLSERGCREAEALAEAAVSAGIATLYTSPLRRAYETARVVGDALGLEPASDERLAESSRGTWEGRLTVDIAREAPELWRAWQRPPLDFRFPGGESLDEHMSRVRAALADLSRTPAPTLAVCHGGTIRCALLHARRLPTEKFHEIRVPHAVLIALDSCDEPARR
jgi:broad specificity phosphatase PhoE